MHVRGWGHFPPAYYWHKQRLAHVDDLPDRFLWARGLGHVGCCQGMNRAFEMSFELAQKVRKEFGMPAKKLRESWMTDWVKVEMTEALKSQFKSWDIEDRDVWDGLDGWAAQGYNINLMFDAKGKTYQVNIIGKAEDCLNAGKGVSAYAGDAYTAYKLALFKVHSVLPNKWEDYNTGTDDKLG